MENDLYEQFVNDLKKCRPQMGDEKDFKRNVMRKIGVSSVSVRPWIGIMRVAASLLLLVSMVGYGAMEYYTWDKRLYTVRNQNAYPLTEKSSWECRQSVRELIKELSTAEALMLNNEIVISKSRLHRLQAENQELSYFVEDLMAYMQIRSPVDYAAYQSGETIQITSWKLRKDYGVCDGINK